jgi:hypothetical protein
VPPARDVPVDMVSTTLKLSVDTMSTFTERSSR